MRGLLTMALAVLFTVWMAPGAATAKSAGQLSSFGGVTVSGSPFRYAAFSNDRHTAHGVQVPSRSTVVARIARDGGKVSRLWQLRGGYDVPAVAYDLRGSGGGLSADGSTLVLRRLSTTYPPPVSQFAVLDTGIRRGRPDSSGSRPSEPIRKITLRGDFSFHAISPDGSTAYLTHRLPRHRGPAYIVNHEVRALDLESGELRSRAVSDPTVPEGRVEGLPITRATSPDGRWAYTLYDANAYANNGGEPFVDALDTVAGRTVRVELPQLADRRNLLMLRMQIEESGRELAVLNRSSTNPRSRSLLRIDTSTFTVSDPGGDEPGGGLAWQPIGVVIIAMLAAIAWGSRNRRRAVKGGRLETT